MSRQTFSQSLSAKHQIVAAIAWACFGLFYPASAKTNPGDAADASADNANPADNLKTVEQNIGESQQRSAILSRQQQKVEQQIAALRERSVTAARLEQESETELNSLQKDLIDLSSRSAHSTAALNERRSRQSVFVAALERVAMLPPEALVFSPQPPIDIERSAILMGAIVPLLRDQVQSLAQDLDQLNTLKQKADQKRLAVLDKQSTIRAERGRLNTLMAQRQALEATTLKAASAEQKRLDALSAQATSLRDLMRRIEQEQQEREERAHDAAARLGASHGREVHHAVAHAPPSDAPPVRLVRPAAGEIVKQFGDGDDFSTSKGLSFQTSPGAQIVSPFSGKIMFAGAFKGYGQILIIDHGGGYHSLLAGLDRIHGVVGQSVVAGEPVGTMGTSGASRTLYLELRWQGQPIDPTSSLEKRD